LSPTANDRACGMQFCDDCALQILGHPFDSSAGDLLMERQAGEKVYVGAESLLAAQVEMGAVQVARLAVGPVEPGSWERFSAYATL
jgi:hypothetical protein